MTQRSTMKQLLMGNNQTLIETKTRRFLALQGQKQKCYLYSLLHPQ